MRGLKKAAAALVPALVKSLVVPNDPLQFPIEHASTERPTAQIPFIHEYHVKDDAFIQFTIPTTPQTGTIEEIEEDLVAVTVPSSEFRGCSEDPNTQIQVNDKTLVATSEQTVNGQIVQRSGSIDSEDPSRRPSKWDLQCACLDEAPSFPSAPSDDCQNVGYVLNFRLSTLKHSSTEGFTLSFSQYKQAKLHRLTTLALSALQVSAASIEELRNSNHWLVPLLQPLEAIVAKVPTATISNYLPVFSSTSVASFRTITTRDLAATPLSSIEALSRSGHQVLPAAATPQTAHQDLNSELRYQLASSESSQTLEDDPELFEEGLASAQSALRLDDSTVAKLKQKLEAAGVHLHSALESIIQKLAPDHSYHAEPPASPDASRNETREFHEQQLPKFSPLPHVSHTSKAVIASIILLIIASGTAFTCIWYRDPRRMAERAARREERINRRLYKKAACRHRFQEWIGRIRGRQVYQPQSRTFERAQIHVRRPSGDSDVEWKDSETALSNEYLGEAGPSTRGVRKGLSEMRDAYGFVEGILRATSGIYRGPRNQLRSSSRGSRHRRLSDAGSEKSMLPPYTEKDEYDDVLVVDGLHFTLRRRIDTPGSSIIATSPRESDCGSTDGEKD